MTMVRPIPIYETTTFSGAELSNINMTKHVYIHCTSTEWKRFFSNSSVNIFFGIKPYINILIFRIINNKTHKIFIVRKSYCIIEVILKHWLADLNFLKHHRLLTLHNFFDSKLKAYTWLFENFSSLNISLHPLPSYNV